MTRLRSSSFGGQARPRTDDPVEAFLRDCAAPSMTGGAGLRHRIRHLVKQGKDAVLDGLQRLSGAGHGAVPGGEVARYPQSQLLHEAFGRWAIDERKRRRQIGHAGREHFGDPPVGDEAGLQGVAVEPGEALERAEGRGHEHDPSVGALTSPTVAESPAGAAPAGGKAAVAQARATQARWPSARPNLAAERAFWRGDAEPRQQIVLGTVPPGGGVMFSIDGHALLLDAPRRPDAHTGGGGRPFGQRAARASSAFAPAARRLDEVLRRHACPAEAERRRMHPLPATRRGRRDLLIVVVMSIALSIAAIIVGMLR